MTLFETNHGYSVMDSIASSLKTIAKELELLNRMYSKEHSELNRMYSQEHDGFTQHGLELKLSDNDPACDPQN